ALDVRAQIGKISFDEAMLITHRGLSGPAILQISSYWREGEAVALNLMPSQNVGAHLQDIRRDRPKAGLVAALESLVPKSFAQHVCRELGIEDLRLADLSNKALDACAAYFHKHLFVPGGTEGYRTAEVTLGGLDTGALSQKTMEVKEVPGLYFIGEVVDVTGHLGGHNFQWAWSSGHAAGQVV
ncbi:MAG: NAD(P)/FAD-dependent oxidoreductase, partial [Pseudomonadota bacterium]